MILSADHMRERPSVQPDVLASIRDRLVTGALPGELEGFTDALLEAAASLVAGAAARRLPGQPAIALESAGTDIGQRLMRLVIVNDDMPFLVDSVASLLAARDVGIRRLLHPIVAVARDASGQLERVEPGRVADSRRESIIYMELDRVDARKRRSIVADIDQVLTDVRCAVTDYPRTQEAMRLAIKSLPDGEGVELVSWLLDRRMTLLGHNRVDRNGAADCGLGIARSEDGPLLPPDTCAAAISWFEAGNSAPLLLKADRQSTVHRRAPLDLIVLPRREQTAIVGLDVYAGLWTSDALAVRPDLVPLLRRRLTAMEEALGFDPVTHAGKALRHAIRELPHDLLIGFSPRALRSVALTAMSLIDRPRPKLTLVEEVLSRFIFGFVWLPREELTTRRREAIGRMLATEARGSIASWAIDLGDGDLALIRYTVALGPNGIVPDAEPLDQRLRLMVRGWTPAVEAALSDHVGASRATRLALSHATAFPESFRARSTAEDAAEDIIRLVRLDDDVARGARLYATLNEGRDRLRLKIYRAGGLVPLSDVVPVLENFGFVVLEEVPTSLDGRLGHIHEFLLDAPEGCGGLILERSSLTEGAIAEVLEGRSENDAFNKLVVSLGMDTRAVVLLRAWFRYLRQTGMSYGLLTTADALTRAPTVAKGLIALFDARHDPVNASEERAELALSAIAEGLTDVAAIDDDRILRRMRGLVEAILRTNAFSPASFEALAFKLDSAAVPALPAPVPWREIWVYSPRVEGIHLRAGPVARGGLRWSDRRDDFRTEILGLMKAQVVKNAVIVPTGAKGGFYAKRLPSPNNRPAWYAEGTESYRIFIRALLSVTDNLVNGDVAHPQLVAMRDGPDPYFVVAADKGTAAYSDTANAIALERGFWLGDAFASGGSNGYDHKAMGITARGAWVSVTRHFAEMGIDVQSDPIATAGCGDMSGDVFGNGMLLSTSIRLVAAFDHRHIFLDPIPDPDTSWSERARLFALPMSSWADYQTALISKGGGVFPRSQKAIPVSAAAAAALGIKAGDYDPSTLIQAILKAPVDLLWFGGIGTYIKASHEPHGAAGDPANDANRVDASSVRAKVIGEGANLSTTQAGRIEFGLSGGRSNTDFIDNSAGVDCSDNEVNIKIALNAEVAAGRLSVADRNNLLAAMTDEVADIVLRDNQLQTLSLSAAERGGLEALPAHLGVIADLENSGRLDRDVEGLLSNDAYTRRAQDGQGLTRPELAVILSHAKLTLQAAIEASPLAGDPTLSPILRTSFPVPMQKRFRAAIETHRLRGEIIATKVANMVVNRLGLVAPFEVAEEEGVGLAGVAGAYLACDAVFGLTELFADIETEPMPERDRLELLDIAARAIRPHIADLIRVAPTTALPGEMVVAVKAGVERLGLCADRTDKAETKGVSGQFAEKMRSLKASDAIIGRVARLYELDGAIAIAELASRSGWREVDLVAAYGRLGEALGLSWARTAAQRITPLDSWERLLVVGLARDFQQLRLDFLQRAAKSNPVTMVEEWLDEQSARVDRFARLVDRARMAASVTPAMLAQVAAHARILLTRSGPDPARPPKAERQPLAAVETGIL